MRILMTADGIGGVWTYVLELGGWLTSHGVEVTVASMGSSLKPEQRRALTTRNIRLEESTYRLEWMDEPWDDVRAAGEWLLALEARHRPDVIHLNGFAHGALPFKAPVVSVAHSSVESWWRAVYGCSAPQSYERYRQELRRGLRGAARIVAPTRAMLSALVEHEPWLQRELSRLAANSPWTRATVIENGIGPRDLNEEEKQPFVFCAGRLWDRAKNVTLLAKAAPTISWPIRCAGGAAQEGVRADVDVSSLDLLGELSLDQVKFWMQTAAVYAAPSIYEPFGLSILEAAAAGCALVLSDIPSLRELWAGACLFADPRDPEAWSCALRSLIAAPTLRRRLALGARARAQRYSAERMARAYLRTYENMTAERVRRTFVAAGASS